MEQPIDLLPAPKVVRRFAAGQFQPHVPAMELKWDPDAPGLAEKTWFLPGRLAIQGPAPTTFGVVIERQGLDEYHVRLVWNDLGIRWRSLRRVEILTSALAPVLQALGTDMGTVLEQSIRGEGHTVWPAGSRKMAG